MRNWINRFCNWYMVKFYSILMWCVEFELAVGESTGMGPQGQRVLRQYRLDINHAKLMWEINHG